MPTPVPAEGAPRSPGGGTQRGTRAIAERERGGGRQGFSAWGVGSAFVRSVPGVPADSATRTALAGHAKLVAYEARMTERYWQGVLSTR